MKQIIYVKPFLWNMLTFRSGVASSGTILINGFIACNTATDNMAYTDVARGELTS